MQSSPIYRFFPIALLIICLFSTGCSHRTDSYTRTAVVRKPSADGTAVFTTSAAVIDLSHTKDGYFMARATASSNVKLQLTGTDGVTYTYNLRPTYDAFPFTSGDGTYQLSLYEAVTGNRYAMLFSKAVSVALADPFGPYLYPNQYVAFSADSPAVAKAAELTAPTDSDLAVITQIYNYMITHFTYDYSKAATVADGYLPDLDAVFAAQTGICLDYAALMTAMLRSQGIPTRLEIGYYKQAYHAWISTYTPEKGWLNGVVRFNGKSWQLLDPTFASTSSQPETFLARREDYMTNYIY